MRQRQQLDRDHGEFVAVGLGVDDLTPADGTTGTGFVQHHDGLRHVFPAGIGKGACQAVGATTGLVGHEQLHRVVGEVRLGCSRCGQAEGQGGGGEQAGEKVFGHGHVLSQLLLVE